MAIRKLEEKDREMTMEFLSEEPAINLFLIGDIEAFGFDKDFQELWGQFDNTGELEGVLLRFNENYIPYWKSSDFDITEFKNIIESNTDKVMMSGKESILDVLYEVRPDLDRERMFFCELRDKADLKEVDINVKEAKIADCAKISEFLGTIEEFSSLGNDVDRLAHKLETKTGRIYMVQNEEGKILSVSQTTAETSSAAMVVGVATDIDERGKGYMSQCLSKLCADVLDEGKTLCLFYDNPKAGSVYHKLGFKSIDKWVMAKK